VHRAEPARLTLLWGKNAWGVESLQGKVAAGAEPWRSYAPDLSASLPAGSRLALPYWIGSPSKKEVARTGTSPGHPR